ncbi:glucans biosynthesis glucosyltransferase MdoH [Nisaea acidiphila]|uniref:Glucans biosynthesis glucosyltransferase H n=1 Tax=Nisaea acidiphila TaxID=1862145 RepID=A0A9J7ASB7_9PROT|nr:glucans biosynthesis glucosyltransferase MdoH [Nisaea acidiphila]UUX49441.1 glucans biosynthesis glucosyltransferase MdoH [Nisaea acidiphila]
MDASHLMISAEREGAKGPASLRGRRAVFAGLVAGTIVGLLSALAFVFARDGLTGIEITMVTVFALNTPWMVIGFWNAVIGFSLLHFRRDWLKRVTDLEGLDDTHSPVTARTAIVMPVFNEDPALVIRNLRAVTDSLDATGKSDSFDIFLLSDTSDPAIAAEERALFENWRDGNTRPDRLHYRRREENSRQKVGNIEDFCERWGDGFEHMIVLDADSVMSGDAILRLVRLMRHNPKVGILQTLVTGMPASSGFARLFQFGMRHGMRSYTTGSAWWQGPDGPYWGHNAIIRIAAFRAHCRLPELPGTRPLGGEILSHDQVEAVFMRRGGYEVRVLPLEDGSYEENPTNLPDFLTRDLRWCQGNMQYLKLFRHPSLIRGVRPMGRVQLLLAIMMYTGAPFWFAFMGLGLVDLHLGATSTGHALPNAGLPGFGLGLFVAVMTMTFAPKLLGVLDIALRKDARRSYGGLPRILAGTLCELIFSMLISPVAALAQTIFVVGLFFGKRIRWDAQQRDDRRVTLREAAAGLWPQTLLGAAFLTALVEIAPQVLPWAAPVICGLLLAVPVAAVTALPGLGRAMQRTRLCAIPEEAAVPEALRRIEEPVSLAPAESVPAAEMRPLMGSENA